MAEGHKVFTNGAVLGASDLNDYLMLQTVMRFADASARDTALSGVLTEGLVAYLKDVDTITMYTGSAWVPVTSAGAWTSWTPTVTQSGAATISVAYAKYHKVGRQVTGNFRVTVTDTGSAIANAVLLVDTPTGISDAYGATSGTPMVCGSFWLSDASAGTPNISGALVLYDSSNFALISHSSGTFVGNTAHSQFVGPLAASDVVSGSFSYESTA